MKPYDRGDGDELLNIRSLTVELPTVAGWVRPVNEVTLRIAPGEAFLSASDGQRKTLTNLNEPEWRQVRGREIAMIFQEPMTSLNPVLRIGTQIEEAVWAHEQGLQRSVIARRVMAALEQAAVPEPDSSPY